MSDKSERIESIRLAAIEDGKRMREILDGGQVTDEALGKELQRICERQVERTSELRSFGFVGSDPVEELVSTSNIDGKA